MKIKLIFVGKTDEKHVKDICSFYFNKITHYIKIEIIEISALKQTKNLSVKEQKQKETALILKYIQLSDKVILLDEKGKTYTSVQFSNFIQTQMNTSLKQLVFVIGGAYGFSDEMYQRADSLLSLSKMTLTHQMVRIVFLEQVYRAFTILNNEPYHHC
ncbi:MAG TPA: 23S rRNA (pseudouridine(1915)-N(3))-methyltransferase RlmH [Bacteroidales bacterium]|nr:23S rRNA (pseudouridine(1915)-N(3))-methyltransferase RlmH [Bacteroidales bacterium]